MRGTKTALLAGIAILSIAGVAQAADPALYPGFTPAKNGLGQPDLTGVWTNTTMTPFERSPKFGDRLAMTKAEAAELEGTRAEQNANSDKPTDPNATVKDLGKDCSGGRGANCNYNAAWTDPGETVMRVHGEPRTSIVTSTKDGRIPVNLKGQRITRIVEGEEAGAGTAQPGSAAVRADPPGRNDNPEGRSLGERCVNMGSAVPRSGLYNNNYAIQQSRDGVLIWSEMNHELRLIRLNSKHRTDGITPWGGDSIGHYEGNTLVVETTGYDPRQNFYNATDALKVTERYTRVAKNRLHYAFSVEDPKTWAQPWGGEYEFNTSQGIFEYACAEGNYGLEAILAGAREEDRQAAAAGKQRADASALVLGLLTALVLAQAATPAPGLDGLVAGAPLTWRLKGRFSDAYLYMPERADRQGVSGGAALLCKAAAGHKLVDCTVLADKPQGFSFGEAASALARDLTIEEDLAIGEAVALRLGFEPKKGRKQAVTLLVNRAVPRSAPTAP